MTSFSRSPRLLKGAIVGIDSFNPLASIIVFQYNPDTPMAAKDLFHGAVRQALLVLPTSWGKMFGYVTFWAQALRPYIFG